MGNQVNDKATHYYEGFTPPIMVAAELGNGLSVIGSGKAEECPTFCPDELGDGEFDHFCVSVHQACSSVKCYHKLK